MDHDVKRSRPSWSTWWNPFSTENTKINWAWWCTPVVPDTREAEVGELLEPRRRRLWWAEIAPLHSSLGNKNKTPSQKNKNKKNMHTNKQKEMEGYGRFHREKWIIFWKLTLQTMTGWISSLHSNPPCYPISISSPFELWKKCIQYLVVEIK